MKILRNFFRFVERQAWRSDWFECTKNIATRSPVLTSKKLYYFKQMQMELEGLLQNGFNDKVPMKIQGNFKN